MARNGSGTYLNPYPNFASGTVISSTEVNANNSQIATALTQSIAVDGQSVVTGDIPLATHKFTAMKDGTDATDSLSLGQAQAEAFVWCGTAGGGADAITLSPSPAITAYAAGQRFVWMASGSTNTGATTVAISGLTAIALQDNGAALTAGQHAAGKMFMGILNTTSTMQIMQVQVSGTDPLIVSSLTVTGDATIGDDLTLLSDASILGFGEHTDVTITHVADSGLTLKNTSTADDTPFVLLMQTGETDIAANDVLGKIEFQAPDEAAGTDAILVAAAIDAVSEGDFSSSSNATKLSFRTGASETATEKMSLSSAGNLTVSGTVTADGLTADGLTVDGINPAIILKDTDGVGTAASGAISFTDSSDTILGQMGYLSGSNSDFDILQSANAAIDISTNATQRMSIEANGDVSFYEDTGTTPKFFWDASAENLGIGTSSPNATSGLTIFSATYPSLYFDNDSATGGGAIRFHKQGVQQGVVASSGWILADTSNDISMLANTGYGLRFYTGGTNERMRIDASGNVGIGTTTPAAARVRSASSDTTSGTFAFYGQNSAGTPLLQVRGDGGFSTGAGAVSPYNLTTGNAASVWVDSNGFLYRSTSSLKYKTDIQDAAHGLAEVMALRSVTYKSNQPDVSGNVPDAVYGGLIAEEVHDAGLTEFVQYADDGTPDALSYGNMVALCVKAIQDQQAIIEALEARITALEA